MSKASKSSASEHLQLEGYEGHFEDFGPYTVGFETYTADAELAPFFVGLPDDRCQCPHMGYVVMGRLKFAFADGNEELYVAGDAYYAAPGHVPTLYAAPKSSSSAPRLSCSKRWRWYRKTWRPEWADDGHLSRLHLLVGRLQMRSTEQPLPRRAWLRQAIIAPPVGIEPTTDRLETHHDQQ